MIRALYDWTMRLADHPRSLRALGVVSFIESSFFPIPPDVLMIPMIIARPSRAWIVATVALVTSVLGGLFGYFIGAVLFETVGQAILNFYGKTAEFEAVRQRFSDPEIGFWAVMIAGVTPIPFKLITISAGVIGMNLPLFIATSIIARGLRFFVVAGLLWRFGAPIRDFIERWLGPVFTLFMVLLIGGFFLVKYL